MFEEVWFTQTINFVLLFSKLMYLFVHVKFSKLIIQLKKNQKKSKWNASPISGIQSAWKGFQDKIDRSKAKFIGHNFNL